MESVNVRPHSRHLVRLVVILGATLGLLSTAVPSASALDVYTTPGKHSQNGRTWLTSCENYSSKVVRCTTRIWGTTAVYKDGKFTVKNDWAFNNLTYKTSNRADWAPFNALVTPGEHTLNGRRWKTECDTSWTGSNGCRSQILATVPEFKSGKYQIVNKWVFNNIVHVTPIKCPVPQSLIRTNTAQPSIVTSACTVSVKDTTTKWAAGSWLAAEYVASSGGKMYTETAFFQKLTGGWAFQAKGNQNTPSICTFFEEQRLPLNLGDSVGYCFKG